MTFDKKIKQIKLEKVLVGVLVLVISIITLILAIIEIVPKDISYTTFNKNEKMSNYSKIIVYYAIGPLLEIKDSKDKSISGYYLAVGQEDDMFIIRLKSDNTQVPIIGNSEKDISLDELEAIEVYGNVEFTSQDLKSILVNKVNTLLNKEIVNNQNFEKALGAYHIDTVSKVENNGIRLFIISAFFAIIGVLYLLINKKIRNNVQKSIDELKAKGELEKVIKEFEGGQLIDYKKLKVYLSPNYIFSYTLGFCVIAFKDIKEVSVSKKSIGSSNKNKYIIILNNDDKEYYIAPIKRAKQKAIFNELLTKIKRTIE